ncbi:hypothetical protein [Pseudomonas sp. H2_D02]
MGATQMMEQLEPLVATDQRIGPVQAQHRHLDASIGEPVQVKGFEARLGVPVEGVKEHGCGPVGKQAGILTAGRAHPDIEKTVGASLLAIAVGQPTLLKLTNRHREQARTGTDLTS